MLLSDTYNCLSLIISHLCTSRPVAAIAARLSQSGRPVTPEMVMFSWLIQCGITPLSGTCTADHMQDDVSVAMGQVRVTAEEAKALCSLIRDEDMFAGYHA